MTQSPYHREELIRQSTAHALRNAHGLSFGQIGILLDISGERASQLVSEWERQIRKATPEEFRKLIEIQNPISNTNGGKDNLPP